MTGEELKLWAGSPLQAVFIKNQKIRLAEFWRLFMEAPKDQLESIQAQSGAHYRILQEYSMEPADLEKLSAETVEMAEEQRRMISRALEKNQREAQDRARSASFPQ